MELLPPCFQGRKSIAVIAVTGINSRFVFAKNARLFARAEMYASELEKRLLELRDAETALEAAQRGKKVAENSPEYDRKKAN